MRPAAPYYFVFLELTTLGQGCRGWSGSRVNYGRFIAEPRLETSINIPAKRKLINLVRYGLVRGALIHSSLSLCQRMGWVDKVPRAGNLYIGGLVKHPPKGPSSESRIQNFGLGTLPVD